MAHPQGLQPLGNAYFADPELPNSRVLGLGDLRVLPDDVLLQVLEWLRPEDLARVAGASKAGFLLAGWEELWRDCIFDVLQKEGIPWSWQGSWRGSYLAAFRQHKGLAPAPAAVVSPVTNFFSDSLFVPWTTGQFRVPAAVWPEHATASRAEAVSSGESVSLENNSNGSSNKGNGGSAIAVVSATDGAQNEESNEDAAALDSSGAASGAAPDDDDDDVDVDRAEAEKVERIREWIRVDNVPRRAGLTYEEFVREFELPNKPVILTDIVGEWPAFRDGRWQPEELERRFGDVEFTCRGRRMQLRTLLAYVRQNQDAMPLYLFDYLFGERAPGLLDDYRVPELFDTDLFAAMGADRPNFRWWLIGGQRSGSTWHQDPNFTSAFNAAIVGRKKWILYPPHVVPPGVIPSADGVDVTVPLSIIEWFDNFYNLVQHTEEDLARARNEFPESEAAGGRKKPGLLGRRRRRAAANLVHSLDVDASSAFRRRLQQQQKRAAGSQARGRKGAGASDQAQNLSYENVAPLECIHKPGEILFIPSGWWHTVLNLDDVCVAVTQNFLNESNFFDVGAFVTGNEGLISGYRNRAEEDGEDDSAEDTVAECSEAGDGGMCSGNDKAALWPRFLEALSKARPEVYERLMRRKAQEEQEERERLELARAEVKARDSVNSELSAIFQHRQQPQRKKPRLAANDSAEPTAAADDDSGLFTFDLDDE